MDSKLTAVSIPMGSNHEHNASRENWDGHPVDCGDAWVLRKGNKVARCSLVTHPFGFELRLITTDLLRSQVCRSDEEVLNTQEHWKAAMIEKGRTLLAL